MRLERTEGAWAEAIAHHGDTKRCPRCGRTLPSREAFRLRKMPEGWRLASYCKRCQNSVQNEFRARKREQLGRPVQALHQVSRRPIPALEVGRVYRITDTGRTWLWVAGCEGNAKPVVYSGPCVGRYGINWAVRTETGIRCFTPSQLVGMQIEEVRRSA